MKTEQQEQWERDEAILVTMFVALRSTSLYAQFNHLSPDGQKTFFQRFRQVAINEIGKKIELETRGTSWEAEPDTND